MGMIRHTLSHTAHDAERHADVPVSAWQHGGQVERGREGGAGRGRRTKGVGVRLGAWARNPRSTWHFYLAPKDESKPNKRIMAAAVLSQDSKAALFSLFWMVATLTEHGSIWRHLSGRLEGRDVLIALT